MNNKDLAKDIIDKIGGVQNVAFVTHCMTRLRFRLNDMSVVDLDALKSIEKIVGIADKGGQFQLIIGPVVADVYKELELLLPTSKSNPEQSTQTQKVEKNTVKTLLNRMMDVVGACITPMLPILTAAGLIKLIATIIGPTMLNLVSETNDLLRLLTFVGDAGFYFFPIFVAYGAAKRFDTNIPITLFIAGIMLHPTLFEIVQTGESFTVYGIPMKLTFYASSFIPMILVTWAMSYVEKGLKKIIPTFLRSMLLPLLTVLIMLPIALTILGPLGTIFGEVLGSFIMFMHKHLGPVAVGFVASFWPLLIATGMHQALIAIAVGYIASQGFDPVILVGAGIGMYALNGISLAFIFKAKHGDDKTLATSSFITNAVGGISEPVIFGVLLRFKKSIVYLLIAGFSGGLIAGLLNVNYYFFGATNLLGFLSFTGPNPNNLIYGIIASVVAFVIGFVLSMVFGFTESNEKHN